MLGFGPEAEIKVYDCCPEANVIAFWACPISRSILPIRVTLTLPLVDTAMIVVSSRNWAIWVWELSPFLCLTGAPDPDPESLKSIEQTLAALPDQAIVMVDGLAFAVMDDLAANESQRLKIVALCHHPLALETGLDKRQQDRLRESEQRALTYARATIVTSEPTQQILIDQFAVPPETIVVARPGTDPVPYAPLRRRSDPPADCSLADASQGP